MSLVCKWSRLAIQDLLHIRQTLAEDNPKAALKVTQRIVQITQNQLLSHPHMGRSGRTLGTRELIIARLPYIIVYRVINSNIQILAVMHSAQQWPDKFEEILFIPD